MLRINNLSIYNRADNRIIIKDFSFTLNPKDKVALIGEEGNGKSSVLKAIANPKELESYADIEGNINTAGEIIGYLPQHLPLEFEDLTPKEYFESKIYSEMMDYNLYYTLLSQFKLEDEMIESSIKLKKLSGGEKIKLQLFIEMMQEPTLLLLDEPTNDLDLKSLSWMEEFILNLKIPVLFVSHDEKFLESTASTIIHIEQLMRKKEPKINIFKGSYNDYVKTRDDFISNQERISKKEKEIFDKKMERFRQIYERVNHEQGAISRQDPSSGKNLKDKMHSIKSMGRRFKKEEENLTKAPDYEEPVFFKFLYDISIHNSKEVLKLSIDKLTVGHKLLSENIRLEVFGPKKIVIVGNNGSGKTTLLKEILKESKKSKLKIGYMPQDYKDLINPTDTPIEYLRKNFTKEEETILRTYLGSMNFTKEEMFHPTSKLSGGQKAKLYFLGMIMDEVEMMILDEPTRNLSPLTGPIIRRALDSYKGVIISVSHDLRYIEEVADEIYLLEKNGLKKINVDEFRKYSL